MVGNHSRAWHTANTAISTAQRKLDDAVRLYGEKSSRADVARTALATAKTNFETIDNDSEQAYDW